VAAAHGAIRQVIPPLTEDRYLAPDLAAADALVCSGQLVARVEDACGRLIV
jgi:histidine ammonia-lyase